MLGLSKMLPRAGRASMMRIRGGTAGIFYRSNSAVSASSGASSASGSNSSSSSSKYQPKVTVDRELPDPFKDKYKNFKYATAYGIGVIVSCVIIFNYEKTTSPIINSVFYFLRRNADVVGLLGEDIQYLSSWPWISGELNTVKGEIDIHFSVKGEKSTGEVYFKASRPNKATPFTIHHWYLEVDGKRVDLETEEMNM